MIQTSQKMPSKKERIKSFFKIFPHIFCSWIGLVVSILAFFELLMSPGNANVSIWLLGFAFAVICTSIIIFAIYFISAWNDKFFENYEDD